MKTELTIDDLKLQLEDVRRRVPKGRAAGRAERAARAVNVRRGERAITLCRPVTVKRTTTADDGTEEATGATGFVYRPLPTPPAR